MICVVEASFYVKLVKLGRRCFFRAGYVSNLEWRTSVCGKGKVCSGVVCSAIGMDVVETWDVAKKSETSRVLGRRL